MGFIHISRENAGIVGLHRPAGAPAGGMAGKRLYYRLLVKGQAAMELCALLVVSGMVEAAIMLVQTFRKAKDDEEHPPRLTFLIAKLMFCAVLIGLAIGMMVLTQNW